MVKSVLFPAKPPESGDALWTPVHPPFLHRLPAETENVTTLGRLEK